MAEKNLIAKAASLLKNARHPLFLSGAGISAESGVPTFCGPDGLWEGHRVEDVATPDGWERDPRLVWRFYQERRAQLREVAPNAAHVALAACARAFAPFRRTPSRPPRARATARAAPRAP